MNTFTLGSADQENRVAAIWRLFTKITLLAIAAFVLAAPAVAQFRTSVQGVVTDP